MKYMVHESKANTRDELLERILDFARSGNDLAVFRQVAVSTAA
jgi:hypothetical protein